MCIQFHPSDAYFRVIGFKATGSCEVSELTTPWEIFHECTCFERNINSLSYMRSPSHQPCHMSFSVKPDYAWVSQFLFLKIDTYAVRIVKDIISSQPSSPF